jgi:hypothetical protein
LANGAGRGYDVGTILRRRRGGRPPLGSAAANVESCGRPLPVEQVFADVLFNLLHTAQLKLGLRDARLLIDMAAVAHEHPRPYLAGVLTRQIDLMVGQLRLGQVSAESHAVEDYRLQD